MGAPTGSERRRAGALAATEVWLLTTLAHAVAGGGLPSWPFLLGIGGLVVVSTAWAMRRPLRAWVAVPALTVAQLGLHLALCATSAPAAGTPAMPGHAHAGHAAATGPPLLDDLSARMVVAHVVSALLTAFVWWVRRRAVAVVLALTGAWSAPPRRGAVATPPVATVSRPRRWLLGDPGRAPPAAYATA